MKTRTFPWALFGTVALTPLACAQRSEPWQHLNDASLAQVRAGWTAPPPVYGPEPYYGLNGAVTLDDVRRDLDTMKSLGFRAVTVQYGFGSKMSYLSPEHLSFFRDFVAEAKKRDLRVWIVDDAGYPSGFAGGKFTAEHPELRMQALAIGQQKTVSAGETFQTAGLADVVAVTALSQDGHSLQVPVEGGRVSWTAPSGTWTVYVVQHVFRTSPTRSDTNPKRIKDASQSLEDYLDPAATAQYLTFTHEAYKRVVGDEFGRTILGFRGDEPDYSISGLPWTAKFFATFEAKKGYDVRPHLAALLQPKDAVLTPEQLAVRADYYDVFADLFRDGFFKPQSEWCARNELEYQVHLNHEEAQLALTRSEGDFFRDMRYVQVPGVDSIWHQIWTDTISDFPRLASSAAHVYGHARSFTESFAAYRPAPDLTQARYILNEQFVRGINLVEAMYFPASAGGRGGPSPLMKDPGYPTLMNYAARVSYVMSQGRPVAEVALLLPSSSLWMGSVRTDNTFVSAERLLSEHQVDFDIVDEDALGGAMTLSSGAFVSASGNRYRTLLVPAAAVLTAADYERLRAFSRAGGKAVFLSTLPTHLAGRSFAEAKPVSPSDFSWASFVPGDLPPVPTPPAQPPPSAPERMNVPVGLWDALEKQLPSSFATLRDGTADVRFTHRELRDASVVLLFNESPRPQSNRIRLARPPATSVEQWDPEQGITHSLKLKHTHGGVTVDLTLSPYEALLLMVH